MTRRLISILASLVIMASLFSGCATKTTNPATSDVTPTTEAKVTLKYISWMTKGEDKPVLKAYMDANPNIIIQDEALDGVNYDKLLKTRILAGDAPDIMLLQWAQYPKFVKEGHLADVTDQSNMTLLTTSPGLDKVFTVGGKKYGFPINTNGGPLPVYYNKVYFDKNNWTAPTTIAEFYALCDKIKADGVEPIVFGGKDKWPTEFFFRYRQYSGMLAQYPEWALALANGDVKPSVMFKKEFDMASVMATKGYIGKASLTLTWPQSVPYFIDGKAAMLPQGPWVVGLPEIAAADPVKFKLAAFTAPVDPINGKKYAMGEVDRLIAISATSKNLAEAKKVFNYFIDKPNLKTYLETQSLTTFLKFDYTIAPVIADHIKNLSTDEYSIIIGQKAQLPSGFIGDAFNDGFQNILAGSTVAAELTKLDAAFDKTKASIVIAD
ncbi:MAG: ABC transporter substrate-binding protein [Saccharofermentanales bacterium]